MLCKLRRQDFFTLKSRSSRFKGRFFIFLFDQNDLPGVSFIVSKRHGGAVQRNQQKRWIRSFLSEHRDCGTLLKVKLLIIALPHDGDYEHKREDFSKCLEKVENLLPRY